MAAAPGSEPGARKGVGVQVPSLARMFKFSKLRDGVYELRFKEVYDMCMTFMRYQEFYESPRYHDKKFTWAEYMAWYSREQSKDGSFSYMNDWGGFNIPVDIIGQVVSLGIDDPNHYDMLMIGIYKTIMTETDRAYLIGVSDVGTLDKHEMTHAMYYLDDEYARKCQRIFIETDPDLIQGIREVLFAKGYTEKTLHDEIQAYLTSDDKLFKDDEKKTAEFEERYNKLQERLKAIHDEHYPIFTKDIAPVTT